MVTPEQIRATGEVLIAGGMGGAGVKGLARVVGPTLDEIGAWLANWTADRLVNVGRIGEAASRKPSADAAGVVSPRVAARILEDGSWCSDDVVVEYLGGVLASSKAGGVRDDRGVSWAAVIADLSTYALRLHYVIYASFHESELTDPEELGLRSQDPANLYVAWNPLCDAMDFDPDEEADANSITAHSLTSLHRAGLIGQWYMAPSTNIARHKGWVAPGASGDIEGGIVVTPSYAGIELYQWAIGLPGGGDLPGEFLTLENDPLPGMRLPPFQVRSGSNPDVVAAQDE